MSKYVGSCRFAKKKGRNRRLCPEITNSDQAKKKPPRQKTTQRRETENGINTRAGKGNGAKPSGCVKALCWNAGKKLPRQQKSGTAKREDRIIF
ncbi:MAG: hypothetical protein HFF83_11340 [Oscillibacter sp.]|jgi:hypothetical protein|nr:hypothetical protein [Oscillibacter sp.]